MLTGEAPAAFSQTITTVSNDQGTVITWTAWVIGNCGSCEMKIENAAKSITGVQSADWNEDTDSLTVIYDEQVMSSKGLSLDNVFMAVAKAGYDNAYYKATKADYEALHRCCQYQRER